MAQLTNVQINATANGNTVTVTVVNPPSGVLQYLYAVNSASNGYYMSTLPTGSFTIEDDGTYVIYVSFSYDGNYFPDYAIGPTVTVGLGSGGGGGSEWPPINPDPSLPPSGGAITWEYSSTANSITITVYNVVPGYLVNYFLESKWLPQTAVSSIDSYTFLNLSTGTYNISVSVTDANWIELVSFQATCTVSSSGSGGGGDTPSTPSDNNGIVRIFYNGAWWKAMPYVYNNGWWKATPYVYNNGWYICK